MEIALAMVLMVGSGLLIRSFQELRGTEMGFRTENLLTLQVTLPNTSYPQVEAVAAFSDQVIERLEATPGIEFASLWGPAIPGQAGTLTTVVPEGKVVESQLDADLARFHQLSPGAIEQLEIPVLSGRGITEEDRRFGTIMTLLDQCDAAFEQDDWTTFQQLAQQVGDRSKQFNGREDENVIPWGYPRRI